MAGRVQHIHHDIAEREPVAIPRGTDRESHIDPGVQHIFGPGGARESTPGGTMIGVDMGIDDKPDLHTGLVGDAQVWFDVAQRVDHSAGGVPATAE
jgi:hypothetical protein